VQAYWARSPCLFAQIAEAVVSNLKAAFGEAELREDPLEWQANWRK
jgi:hypothetical protein